jgi:hypothetical protein
MIKGIAKSRFFVAALLRMTFLVVMPSTAKNLRLRNIATGHAKAAPRLARIPFVDSAGTVCEHRRS